MAHYTKKFQEAWDKVKEINASKGERAARVAFRDAMLELGHDERVRNLYRIQDKLTKKAKFFAPNKPQEEYLKSKAKRNIILKCRQVGFTTLNCLRAYDLALWEANTRTGILCHKLGTVKTIFNDITKFVHNWFIRDWGHLYKPVQKQDSASAISFQTDGLGRALESSLLVMHDFRGKTLHFLHVSEAARVEGDRLIGSLNGVPENGEITLESTAAGRSGEFYRLWGLWRSKGRTAPYRGFFIPWYKHYPEDPDSWDFPEEGNWSNEERDMLAGFQGKITKAHLLWRRWCIDANCAGDDDRFHNEYPINDQDCFISNAASVFPYSIIKMHDRNTRDPIFVGHLISDGKKPEIHEDPRGVVAIWEEPDPSHTYVMGADPAGGVGKDRGAAYIKDQKTNKLVARVWGDLIPADFAKEIYKLAQFYNKAWICVEANNHGHVVIHVLKELEYRNLYKRHAIDEFTKRPAKKVGFVTSNQTKILITEKFKTAAKENKMVILDKDLLSEMTTFVQVASKMGSTTIRREASPGAHDDLVMAASLTEEMNSQRKVDYGNEESSLDHIPEEVRIDPETGFVIGEYR